MNVQRDYASGVKTVWTGRMAQTVGKYGEHADGDGSPTLAHLRYELQSRIAHNSSFAVAKLARRIIGRA